jgi:uncharacterized membrane protein
VTVGEWLRRRTPAPPDALRVRVTALLGDSLSRDARQTTDVCLAAAERLVATLVSADCTTRESALDLLTADALVTYAFEAAGEAPASLSARASEAMTRIAAIGGISSNGATA